MREGQKTWGPEMVIHRASELLQEYRDVQPVNPRMVVRSMDLCWKPPDSGVYKVNFDGALFLEQRCAGLGVVVRDLVGLVVAALSQ